MFIHMLKKAGASIIAIYTIFIQLILYNLLYNNEYIIKFDN
jgi:hypothetical protein